MSTRIALQATKLALAAGSLLVLACGGGGGGSGNPVAPSPSSLVLSSVAVAMNGQPMTDGMSVHRSTTPGGNTRFEAHLMDGSHGAIGDQAMFRYQRPMGMMNPNGTMPLYDDGTHGDRVANDGVYCYEDDDGGYGLHMRNAAMGQYRYEFWGMDPGGHETNHMSLRVTVTP